MKSKLMCLLMVTGLVGCNAPKDEVVYTCGSPVGTFQVKNQEGVKVTLRGGLLRVETLDTDISISFINCIAVRNK